MTFLPAKTLRTVLFDLPLTVLFATYSVLVIMHYVHDTYWVHELSNMEWNGVRRDLEMTYYNRPCTAEDITTQSVSDLVIHNDTDTTRHMLVHGMSLYPEVLSQDTATRLRDYVLFRNANLKSGEAIQVLSNAHRYSFAISATEDPIVSQALQELGTNQRLKEAMEDIMGTNPAVIELTAITVEYGSKDQVWHADIISEGSPLKYGRSFFPSYSLFVPLQDTTTEMGATAGCPGSHICGQHAEELCQSLGFPVSGTSTWKTGHGFLMNQQAFHRGPGHYDKHAKSRVMFIVTFAPRPRERSESRLIGMGGSYSTKWDMWGHTMEDLARAPHVMTFPWAQLRALGLYKLPRTDWGWDYITVVSMRIANQETGFSNDDLSIFLENGGFSFVPLFLHGTGETWDVFLFDTLARCKRFVAKCNVVAMAFSALCLVSFSLFRYYRQRQNKMNGTDSHQIGILSVWKRACFRLFLTHGTVTLIAILIVHRVNSSFWAKDIIGGRLYTSPFLEVSMSAQRTTFPTRADVLIETRLSSEYLGSYNRLMEVHPGNEEFTRAVKEWSPYFQSYAKLAPVFQERIADSVLTSLTGRLLIQTPDGSWSVLTEQETNEFTQKSLLMTSNQMMAVLFLKLKYMRSDCQFVTSQRIVSMSRHQCSQFLNHLLGLLFTRPHTTAPLAMVPIVLESKTSCSLRIKSTLPSTPQDGRHQTRTKSYYDSTRLPPLPNKGNDQDDLSKSWIMEGDIVESKFQCKYQEFYRGYVERVNAENLYNVSYEDGDGDMNVPVRCVTTFIPYQVNELVDAVKEEDNLLWFQGYIHDIVNKEGDLFDISFEDKEIMRIPAYRIRRFNNNTLDFEEGHRVEAKFRGTDTAWLKGTISGVQKDDGTYSIAYDDGDIDVRLGAEFIRQEK
eukprot:CAMPEP_0198284494 /NCGR_PEP_ID=MMETSP1449-20131203/3960_1 /TAXON_ID=420275 /ORGANISM="Attheya septentrionalis, Strain CCMP2084" /LENGTH=899 /DNA_ID=CAMNT_0043981587 /DNA_START=100 /DNA_END=2799 /DNA_ORIENTATION=+